MLRKIVKTQSQSEGETSESTKSINVSQNTRFSSQLTDNNNRTEVSDIQSLRTDIHRNLSTSANESDSDSSIEAFPNENRFLVQDPMCRDTNIGSVVIQSSSNVHIGHKIIYNGPVTINQNPNPQNEQINRESENRMAEILNQLVISPDSNRPLRIVSRNEWFARSPEHELDRLELPAVRIIIAHTAGSSPSTQMEIVRVVRDIQDYHIETRGFYDIGYNFLIGGDGSVYVGRGWDFKGDHSRLFNQRSICIAFIGNFYKNLPPQRSLIAAQQLMEAGVELGKLAKDYRLYGHRQLIPTISPGNKLYEVIQTWKHWSEDVIAP